jgi:hypothetical protein
MILFEGTSYIDGKPIVAIATGYKGKSSNRKTGAMVQVWVLRQDIPPTEAKKTGADFSVCGDCPLRQANGGGCYVNVGQAPLAIWRKYKRGGYPVWDKTAFDRPVRFGAYGDFAALPPYFVAFLKAMSPAGYTGYTHGWRYRQDLAPVCMASVHTIEEKEYAKSLGFRTFRTGNAGSGDILCPSETGISCAQCKLCCGSSKKAKDIYIPAHGPAAKKVDAISKMEVMS